MHRKERQPLNTETLTSNNFTGGQWLLLGHPMNASEVIEGAFIYPVSSETFSLFLLPVPLPFLSFHHAEAGLTHLGKLFPSPGPVLSVK